MKKYVLMIASVLMFFGTIYVVSFLHNNTVAHIPAYRELLLNNFALYLSIIFVLSTCVYALIFKIRQVIHKDPSISLIKTLRIRKISPPNILLLIGIGIAGWLFSIGLIDIEYTGNKFPDLQLMVSELMKADSFIIVILCAGIIMPMFEEILFRGIIFNEFRRHLPLVIAILLQAGFYAFFQPSLIISIISIFSGIIYCVLYLRMNSILAPIIPQTVAMSSIYITEKIGLHQFFLSLGQPALYVMTIASLLFLIGSTLYVWKGKEAPYVANSSNLSVPHS
jgi:membrane protease YdiL (CAAX protease family)